MATRAALATHCLLHVPWSSRILLSRLVIPILIPFGAYTKRLRATYDTMATEEAEVTTAAVSSKGGTVKFQKVRVVLLLTRNDSERILQDQDHLEAEASQGARPAT